MPLLTWAAPTPPLPPTPFLVFRSFSLFIPSIKPSIIFVIFFFRDSMLKSVLFYFSLYKTISSQHNFSVHYNFFHPNYEFTTTTIRVVRQPRHPGPPSLVTRTERMPTGYMSLRWCLILSPLNESIKRQDELNA